MGFWQSVGNGVKATGQGIRTGTSKGWHAWSNHRVNVASAKSTASNGVVSSTSMPAAFSLADIEAESMTSGDGVKDVFAGAAGLWGPFVLALILSLSNGYFFAGFHDPSWQLQIALAYAGGATLEAIGLAAIFRAAKALKNGTRGFFALSFGFALTLAAISLLAQYMYLQLQMANGTLVVPDSAVSHIPLFNLLIGIGGMQGHDWLFLIRGGAFHLAELGCTFLISKKNKSLQRLIAQQSELQDARLTWERKQMVAEMESSLADQFRMMMAQQRRMSEQNFGRVMSVQSIPDADANVDMGVLLQALQDAGVDTTKLLASGSSNNGNGHKKKAGA